ncbi:MAG: hypothetical protein HQM15_04770 [Deltaproteobacteria bacterium]|nr:hypothetical protein [Deltaproteobacteria bacterium]
MANLATATPAPASTIKNHEKAALLVLSMGEEAAGSLMKELSDEDIRKIGNALLGIQNVPSNLIQQVLDEFSDGVDSSDDASEVLNIDGKHALEKMLHQTLPPERSGSLLGAFFTPASEEEKTGLKKLINEFSFEALLEAVKEEHPQVIALIMNYSKRSVAKKVLAELEGSIQIEVYIRMAQLEKISSKAVEDIKVLLREKKPLSAEGEKEKTEEEINLSGLQDTILLLKTLKEEKSTQILEEISKKDAYLGLAINKKMFTLEDLERSDDAGIRELLKTVKMDDLKVALKDAPEALKNKIFSNMSQKASTILKEDMDVMPPQKVEAIESAQETVLKEAKELIKQEKMSLTPIKED